MAESSANQSMASRRVEVGNVSYAPILEVLRNFSQAETPRFGDVFGDVFHKPWLL